MKKNVSCFFHYQIIFKRQVLGKIWFECLVLDSELKTKAVLNMGCQKTLEFLACSLLRTESQKGEVKMQARLSCTGDGC